MNSETLLNITSHIIYKGILAYGRLCFVLLDRVRIGFAITGCFAVMSEIIDYIGKIIQERAEVIPIASFSAYEGYKWEEIERITNKSIIHTIQEAEHIVSMKMVDILVVLPCTGNTLAKIANGIADTPVTVCAKYCLAKEKVLVIGMHVADGLGANAYNIGKLLNTKNIFFVPFRQPNPITKPNLISYDKNYIIDTINMAINKEQLQPLLV